MTLRLPELPYSHDALSPVLSGRTMMFHHGKHHAGYVATVNQLVSGTALEGKDLAHVIASSSGPLQNAAAQAFNHALLWTSMTPSKTSASPALTLALEASFGTLAKFRERFTMEAKTLFGSGWTWLVARPSGALDVLSTPNAGLQLHEERLVPLLVCDVWEHAYYLDHQNDRGAYVDGFYELIDWRAAGERFAEMKGAAQ